jgi:hypothetical protein
MGILGMLHSLSHELRQVIDPPSQQEPISLESKQAGYKVMGALPLRTIQAEFLFA